jgi:predicted MFS family arabinose efflux permease
MHASEPTAHAVKKTARLLADQEPGVTKELSGILIFMNLFLGLGFNLWQAISYNFAIQELGISPVQNGILHSIREIPGFLGFFVVILALVLPELTIASISLAIMGLGLVLIGSANSFLSLVMFTFVFSVGFHYFSPANDSIVLMAFGKEKTPAFLGKLLSLGALVAAIATVAVFLFVEGTHLSIGPVALDIPSLGFRATFRIAGALVLLAGIVATIIGGKTRGTRIRHKIVLRRTYWLYYVLIFLWGSRRHIFTTFAVYLLIKVKGVSVQQTAILFFINLLISTYSYRKIGGLVGVVGERRILTVNFLLLIGIFICYALAPDLWVLYILFVLDNLLFGTGIALNTYFQKIALPEDVTANVSMGVTITHIAALFTPWLGGMIWDQWGYQTTFILGAGICALSLVLTQWMKSPKLIKRPAFE